MMEAMSARRTSGTKATMTTSDGSRLSRTHVSLPVRWLGLLILNFSWTSRSMSMISDCDLNLRRESVCALLNMPKCSITARRFGQLQRFRRVDGLFAFSHVRLSSD
jgi:hypothetical protein